MRHYPDNLSIWFQRLTECDAFRDVDWSDVSLAVVATSEVHSYGQADDSTNTITIWAGLDEGNGVTTLLHEMAHVAAYEIDLGDSASHGESWRSVYSQACAEFFGAYPALRSEWHQLDRSVNNIIARTL